MKKLLFLIPVLAMFTACQIFSDGMEGCTKEVEVRLYTEKVQTRADATDRTIKTVDILVFDGKDKAPEEATFLYHRYAVQRSADVYNATLNIGSDLDLYFAVNARELIEQAVIAEGAVWSNVQKLLVMYNPDQIDRAADGLPMWGYRHSISIADAATNDLGTVRLLRAVASSDVTVTAPNFTLDAVHVVFGSTKGYLAFTANENNMFFRNGSGGEVPAQNVNMENPQYDFGLRTPEIPAGTTTTVDWRYAVPTATPNAVEDLLYFYENEGPVGTNGKRNTKIILEGVWDDPDTAEEETNVTYYPLSFRNPTITNGSNDKLQPIRNRKFIIIISGINGAGYDTRDEAKEGEDLNTTYRVIPWDNWEDGDIIIDETKFLSVGDSRNEGLRKAASLYRNATSTDEIAFHTNIALDQFEMTLSENGTEQAAGVIANEFYKVEIVKGNTIGDVNYGKFVFTALKDYAVSNPVSTVTVTSGRIRYTISITQRNSDPKDWIDGGNQNQVLGN